MRIVSHRSERGDRAGVLTDQGLVDAAAALGEEAATVRGLLAEGRLDELRECVDGAGSASSTADRPELLPPAPDPDKIVCIGLNYRSHAEGAGSHDGISFSLDLNGERMQAASTLDLIFPIPELLSRLSHWMTLEPGDIVSTGGPAGVGSVRQPRVWLQPGERIEISSPQLGTLETGIAR